MATAGQVHFPGVLPAAPGRRCARSVRASVVRSGPSGRTRGTAPVTLAAARNLAAPGHLARESNGIGIFGEGGLPLSGWGRHRRSRSPAAPAAASGGGQEEGGEEGGVDGGLKLPSANTILIGLIAIVAVCTWLLPAGSYMREWSSVLRKDVPIPGTYERVAQSPQGLVAVLLAPILGVQASIDICLFLLVIGGFLSVVNRTGAIDAGLERAVACVKGREIWMIPILMLVFAANSSSWGMFEESMPFYPIIIPVMMRAGYDKLTALAVILLGCGVGLVGSISNAFATVLAAQAVGIPFTAGILPRAVILTLSFAAGVTHVVRYAQKVKADPSTSLVASTREADEKHFLHTEEGQEGATELTPRRSVTLGVFTAAFVVMVWGVAALGWGMNDMSALFLGASAVVAAINQLDEGEFWDSFMGGARDMLGVSLVIGLATGIVQVMNAGLITDTILQAMAKAISGMTATLTVNAMFLFECLLSFLIPSSSGLAMLTMPILAPLADFSNVHRHLLVTAYQSANGLVNIVAPTSGVVMGALALSRISLFKWIEFTAPLLVQITLIITVTISVCTMM